MPYAIQASWAIESTTEPPEDARDWRRMAEQVKRDHASMRELLDDVERACRAVEERRRDGIDQFRQAVSRVYVAFDAHVATEEACFAPILRTVDAWGELRVVHMVVEHNEQRRIILELVQTAEAETASAEPDALVGQARSLLASFRTDLDAEERSLDEAGLVPRVMSDQEDG